MEMLSFATCYKSNPCEKKGKHQILAMEYIKYVADT